MREEVQQKMLAAIQELGSLAWVRKTPAVIQELGSLAWV
jgi:hypothetical protein